MSPTSISTCPLTCSFFFGFEARVTLSYSTIISINFCRSISIITRSLVKVSPTSTLTYTCSSLMLHGANAPSSTFACMCFCIFHPSKPPSFMTSFMPSTNLVEACSSSLIVLFFSKFASTKNVETTKQNKNQH